MKEVRFASIPKCASRSLKALGLLGELEGRCHTKITEYPEWEKYEWFAVDRPEREWLESWWMECRDTKSMFGQWAGFLYQNLDDDLDSLNNTVEKVCNEPEKYKDAPARPGANAWIPSGFSFEFRKSDKSFKGFCFSIITDGIPCEHVPIADLDAWLESRGYAPVHENVRENAIS